MEQTAIDTLIKQFPIPMACIVVAWIVSKAIIRYLEKKDKITIAFYKEQLEKSQIIINKKDDQIIELLRENNRVMEALKNMIKKALYKLPDPENE